MTGGGLVHGAALLALDQLDDDEFGDIYEAVEFGRDVRSVAAFPKVSYLFEQAGRHCVPDLTREALGMALYERAVRLMSASGPAVDS